MGDPGVAALMLALAFLIALATPSRADVLLPPGAPEGARWAADLVRASAPPRLLASDSIPSLLADNPETDDRSREDAHSSTTKRPVSAPAPDHSNQ